ncbi:MAG: ferritin-like domain-containing protein [Phycisphaerales bacterium]
MLDTLNGLLAEQVKDLYNAEHQLIKALPKLAKAATEPGLKQAFLSHLEETRTHVDRLEKIAEKLGIKPTGKTCKAMQGLIAEGSEVLDEKGEEPVVDAALIAAAQRVEHYEISAYGTVRAIAEKLGKHDIAKLLQATLDEERAADEKLTDISEGGVLEAAMAAGAG